LVENLLLLLEMIAFEGCGRQDINEIKTDHDGINDFGTSSKRCFEKPQLREPHFEGDSILTVRDNRQKIYIYIYNNKATRTFRTHAVVGVV